MEEVCKQLEVKTVPDSLVCCIHLLMMFQRKIKSLWQEIHDAFGTNVIKDCFITGVGFRNENLFTKLLLAASVNL